MAAATNLAWPRSSGCGPEFAHRLPGGRRCRGDLSQPELHASERGVVTSLRSHRDHSVPAWETCLPVLPMRAFYPLRWFYQGRLSPLGTRVDFIMVLQYRQEESVTHVKARPAGHLVFGKRREREAALTKHLLCTRSSRSHPPSCLWAAGGVGWLEPSGGSCPLSHHLSMPVDLAEAQFAHL